MVAAFEVGGTIEQVVQRLTAQPEADPASAADNMQPEANSTVAPHGSASSSASLAENVGAVILDLMNDVEGPSDHGKAEERDVEMEDELSADIAKADALADYDIEVNIEGEAITEYLTLVDSAGSYEKMVPSQ